MELISRQGYLGIVITQRILRGCYFLINIESRGRSVKWIVVVVRYTFYKRIICE